MDLVPDIDELIARAYISERAKKEVARDVKYLPPTVPIEKILKLIELVSETTDEIVVLELALSLAKLLEKASDEWAEKLVEELITREWVKLLGLILSNTRRELNPNLLFESIRRMLESDDEDAVNTGLLLLKEWQSVIDSGTVEEMLVELLSSKPELIKTHIDAIVSVLGKKKTKEVLLVATEFADKEAFEKVLQDEGTKKAIASVLGESFYDALLGVLQSKE